MDLHRAAVGKTLCELVMQLLQLQQRCRMFDASKEIKKKQTHPIISLFEENDGGNREEDDVETDTDHTGEGQQPPCSLETLHRKVRSQERIIVAENLSVRACVCMCMCNCISGRVKSWINLRRKQTTPLPNKNKMQLTNSQGGRWHLLAEENVKCRGRDIWMQRHQDNQNSEEKCFEKLLALGNIANGGL